MVCALREASGCGFIATRPSHSPPPLVPSLIHRYALFERLLASEEARPACDAWYPPASGVRERIRAIHATFPDGFAPIALAPGEAPKLAPAISADEAEWELRRREALRNAKRKLRGFAVMMRAMQAKKANRSFKAAFKRQQTVNRLSRRPCPPQEVVTQLGRRRDE